MFDKDRFPSPTNEGWQRTRASTNFYDRFIAAEQVGMGLGEGKKVEGIKANVKRTFHEELSKLSRKTDVRLEFVNVLSHRALSWERQMTDCGLTISKFYDGLVRKAHKTFRAVDREANMGFEDE